MRVVESFPHRVRELEHVWIPMSDGARLGARVWLPEGAEAEPVPAILEYLPYGKREGTRSRDEATHRYLAGHGYATLRVDVRGTGESEGVLEDEYSEAELRDGLSVIEWIAGQAWCDGTVGMMGISWGGFNALQLAARRPPALKGIVTVCASDDRYADDAHYTGGCLLLENFRWGAMLFTLAAHPPDPLLVGDAWRAMWQQRLQAARPFAAEWLRHPLRDAYWRRGSICEDWDAIQCPVYAVGGWADAYTNAVPRLLAGLRAPRRGLVGPWAHVYPHHGVPGPAIGFLQELLGFFDAALRGRGDPAPAPMLRAWMQESVPPRAGARMHPGRWVAEPAWPSPRIRERTLCFGAGTLGAQPARRAAPTTLAPDARIGLAAGAWCAFGHPRDLPGDQREDDARSLMFETPPLDTGFEILGAARAELELSVDREVAFVVARVVDVAPDGTAALVSWGVSNLTHAAGHAALAPLAPGQRRRVALSLDDVAHAFPAGHRVRLALSTHWWPLIWPSPAPVTLRVFPEGCRLALPERLPRRTDAALPPFPPAEFAAASETHDLGEVSSVREATYRSDTGEIVTRVRLDTDASGAPVWSRIPAIDLEAAYAIDEESHLREDDPLSARSDIRHRAGLRRQGWDVEVETHTRVSGDAQQFRLEAELRARENGREVFARSFDERIPRRGL